VHVYPQDRAEEIGQILAPVVRVAPSAAITESQVEKAVRAERDLASVVIGERLSCRQNHQLGQRISNIRIGRRRLKTRECGITGRISEVHDEAATRRIVWIEGHAEQPLLASIGDAQAQIQKRVGQEHPIF
jgi:hypothetical protein